MFPDIFLSWFSSEYGDNTFDIALYSFMLPLFAITFFTMHISNKKRKYLFSGFFLFLSVIGFFLSSDVFYFSDKKTKYHFECKNNLVTSFSPLGITISNSSEFFKVGIRPFGVISFVKLVEFPNTECNEDFNTTYSPAVN